MEVMLLIIVAIACFFILKWSDNVESKHKEKERKRLKISEDNSKISKLLYFKRSLLH
jgi:large-conductance mechanosensitive channel